MNIHSIEAIAVEIPLGKNFGGSTYTVLKRCTVITRMRTQGGLVSEVYKDGMIGIASDPGFGLVLDDAMIRRYRVG